MKPCPSRPAAAGSLLLAICALAAPLGACQADGGWHATWCAWKRTAQGPNSLATPLRGYYIPRTSWLCGYDDCAGSTGAVAYSFGDQEMPWHGGLQPEACACPREALPAGTCSGFERLGQIPNEFASGGDPGAPVATAVGR